MAALFVDPTDFTNKPYKIPNQEESKDFDQWLEDKEDEILKDLLGWQLWDSFSNAIEGGTTTTKWVNLRDGTTYEYGGYTFKWEGMEKMLIPYIYSMFIRESFDKLTGSGVVLNGTTSATPGANFTIINPSVRITRAQNEFSRMAGGCYRADDSLYGFLLANYEDTYTEWSPTSTWKDPGKENQFDL